MMQGESSSTGEISISIGAWSTDNMQEKDVEEWVRGMEITTEKPKTLPLPATINQRGVKKKLDSLQESVFETGDDTLPTQYEYVYNAYAKRRYVAYMLRWCGLEVRNFLTLVKSKEREICSSGYYYSSLAESAYMSSKTLLQGVLLDCCFTLFALLSLQNVQDSLGVLKEKFLDSSSLYEDTVESGMYIKIKLIYKRTQIPWFLIKDLAKYTNLHDKMKYPLERLAISCFDEVFPRNHKDKEKNIFPTEGFYHLLHIFHWSRVPKDKFLVDQDSVKLLKRETTLYIPSATDLEESATVFKKSHDSSIDIVFNPKTVRVSAVMHISTLHLFYYSSMIFDNLLYFERIFPTDDGLAVTAYLACMVRFVQSEADVKLFRKRGILANTMKTESEILQFIENWRSEVRDVPIPKDLYTLSQMVMGHHENPASRNYAAFKRQYCPNRWIIFSILAAFILFALTIVQTIYTVLSYYKG